MSRLHHPYILYNFHMMWCFRHTYTQIYTNIHGHMQKQEMEMEMEIGNGNGNKKHTNHGCNVFFIVCLAITLVFYLYSNGYRTGIT